MSTLFLTITIQFSCLIIHTVPYHYHAIFISCYIHIMPYHKTFIPYHTIQYYTIPYLECSTSMLNPYHMNSIPPYLTQTIPYHVLNMTCYPVQVNAPVTKPAAPLQMLCANIDYDDFKGRVAIGRVTNGTVKKGQTVSICK
jgi:hypothetical protein